MNNIAYYKFRFGWLAIGYNTDTITWLKRCEEPSSDSHPTPLTDKVFEQIKEYLAGKRREFDFRYELNGTEFQKRVWAALCTIPYGETRSYKQIATQIGSPRAARAVGMANNRNPITIAVPCHRVIGASGKLVGYAGGMEMKEAILELEKQNR